VRGVRHLRSGQPNQDAVGWSRAEDAPEQPVVVAVADGHGSALHPRSGEGARAAVEIAVALLGDWLRTAPFTDTGEALPQRIVAAWRRLIEQHLVEHPLVEQPTLAEAEIHELYGTTLLAVGAYRGKVLCLQIGDGDILALTADGTQFKPLADSLDCIENLTDSLCQEDAVGRFRLAQLDSNVELLLLATDGYGNSYENDADFEEIGPDYLALLRRVGVNRVAAGLPGWLAEVTRTGSGDDITLGLLWRQRR
jgi:serine/threonine protein phosphatase PrpC